MTQLPTVQRDYERGCYNTKIIDENGDLHVMRILDGLDSLYGVSMTFQSLNSTLCGLQQKPMEGTRAYYN